MKGQKGKYAWSVKVGEKGQFVLPKEAREVFQITPGDNLILLGDIDRGLAILPASQTEELQRKIFGGKQ